MTVSPPSPFISEAPFESHYTFASGPVLGIGVSGVVRECLDNLTGERLACKSISKSNLRYAEDIAGIAHEIMLMARLPRHPNIVSFRGAYECSEYCHLVMEICEFGELFDYVRNERFLPEAHAAELFSQIGQAVHVLHSQGKFGILHRDLKPENILLSRTKVEGGKAGKLQVKLADFGLALELPSARVCGAYAGSPLYMAPEVIRRDHVTLKSDQWSLGVILYAMLSGELPFGGDCSSAIFQSVQRGAVRVEGPSWENVSSLAKDLLLRLLHHDSSRRPSSAEMLLHPWFKHHNLPAADSQLVQLPKREVSWAEAPCSKGPQRPVRWYDGVAAVELVERSRDASWPESGYRRRQEAEGEKLCAAITPRELFPREPGRASPINIPPVPLSPPFTQPHLHLPGPFRLDPEFESPTSTIRGPSHLSVTSDYSPAGSPTPSLWPSPPPCPSLNQPAFRLAVSNPNLRAYAGSTSPSPFSSSEHDARLSEGAISRRPRVGHMRSRSDLNSPLPPPAGENSYNGSGAMKRWRCLKRQEILAAHAHFER